MANILKGYRGNKTPLFQQVAGVAKNNAEDEKYTYSATGLPISKKVSLSDASKKNTVGVINMGSSKGMTKTYDASKPEGSRISTSETTPVTTSSDEEAAEIARIEAYAKKHKVKGSVYEKPSSGSGGQGLLGLGLFPKHNTQNTKAQSQQANKTRRIGARKNRQKNRQEFFSNIGTGENISNHRQRKKSGTSKAQKDGVGDQKSEGGCGAGGCTP